ncbi:MAG TPA: hypothetical protein VF883_22240 [Thermoanaerobaculia bacterium]|jgi:dipeptidyl aminopeptidase/acylaminoacyl peptidase
MRALVLLLLASSALARNSRFLETHRVNNMRGAEGVTIQRIVYESDGLKIGGYAAIPKGEEKLPCLILNRGGNANFSTWTATVRRVRSRRLRRGATSSRRTEYRGAAGFSEGKDEFGGADTSDVLNQIPLLDAEPRCQAKRIGMIGWSRGGMMT